MSSPYTPKISRKCASVTFFVSFSTTIFALRCVGGGLRSLEFRGERDRVGERDMRRGSGERDNEREERGVMERRGVRERDLDGDGMISIVLYC